MRRLIKWVAWLSLFAALGFGVWLYNYAKSPLHLMPEAQEITIKPKSTLKSIGEQLVEQHVITQAWPFVALGRVLPELRKIAAAAHKAD